MLAGVSVDYYARLEQGRNLTPSDSVLDAIARALRLTSPQRSQLYMLARGTPRPNDTPPREIVRPNVRRLLLAGSAAFRALWDRHDVAAPSSGQKRYRHRVAGEMTVLHEATQLLDDQWLYLYWVERGSPSEQAMNRLRASVADEDS